ncbi:LuxR C-terminal-related transcriptional regulator [Streptomyces prunicolor]|uniref:LuxR C-terminal-related transcriptional regulator n=1 Tax=Streptomyces prunicolor TaxID=67348 RepID=A0ABU4F9L7_9ACTN|nr:LuxR C-terminal-related transcriptional regulator [Streptomyces prunicolor]MDV7217284.1 LuxR C-terminal-related transcriptional regulator [Streptomyces prunicolor]
MAEGHRATPEPQAAAGSGHAAGRGRPGLIDRRDLVAALDRAAEKQVTLVSAPAGSGKTSLLRTWADRPHQDRRRIAFLSVRPGQQDAQLFWLALLDAVRTAVGAEGAAEPSAVTPGFDGGVVRDKVLSEITASPTPFFLVIDDLHELESAAAVEQLGTLLTGLPPGVHAIVATRHDPSLRLHRLRLAGELAEIRAAHLRFTEAETRELLAATKIVLSDEVAGALHQRTEGWAAGLRLAVLSLTGHPDPERFVAEFSGSHRTVAEYLLAEMLERQPPHVQRLLLRTSLLDRVNGELADLLTGATGSERILLDLEDANAFVVALDAGRTWFRYHHMFADLLRLELRRTLPGNIPELHRQAARWFAEHAQAADAVRHLQAAGDWAEAARLLADHTVSLTLDGQAGTVVALLHAFPARTGEEHPELALVHANADLYQHRLDEAQAHLEIARAYADTTAPDRRQRLRMAIASLDLLLARLRGNFDAVFEQADALPSRTTGQSTTEVALAGDLRALALLNLGVTEAWSLRLDDSERHLLEGVALARDSGRPYLEVACLAHLGFASGNRSFALVRRRCEEALALADRYGWGAEPVIVPAQVSLAGTLICTGEFDLGAQWLERARRATQSEGEPGVRLLVHLVSAMLPAARGQLQETLAELTAAEQVHSHMRGEHGLWSRVIGWTAATQARLGMVEQARATLAALDERRAATGEIRTAAAVIRLAEQDPAGARRALRPVLDGTAPVNSFLTPIEAHLLDALACRDLGDKHAAGTAVEQALNLAEPDRMILPFAMTGAWELLETLPQRTSHAALVSDILDVVRGTTPGSPDRPPSVPAEDLSPSELRVLRYLPTNLTRPEIAGELSVSLNTVNTHIRRIYAKLGAGDRSAAVQRGRELRLLSNGRG